jgi:Ca2+-binding EF-hand superfamily protein
MGFISSLFGVDDNANKIHKVEFEKALKYIPNLTDKEKTYIKGVFSKDLKDGSINIDELKKELTELKSNQTDPLSDNDVRKIKEKLSGIMVEKWKR